MTRWKPFSKGELDLILQTLRRIDAHWPETASNKTVQNTKRIRNHRDRLVSEIHAEIDDRRTERVSGCGVRNPLH